MDMADAPSATTNQASANPRHRSAVRAAVKTTGSIAKTKNFLSCGNAAAGASEAAVATNVQRIRASSGQATGGILANRGRSSRRATPSPRIVCATAMDAKFAVDAPNAAQPSHRNQFRSLDNANSQKVLSNPTQSSQRLRRLLERFSVSKPVRVPSLPPSGGRVRV